MDSGWLIVADNPLAALAEWTASVVETLDYVDVAALLALENLVPPIPSELILSLSGFLVERGRFSFSLVVLAATCGSVVGALILYAVGRALGEVRFRTLADKIPLLGADDVDRARDLFARHGGAAVFPGRLLPGVRSVISIPAGFERMPLWQFLACTAAGSAAWNTALIGAGWALGTQWQRAGQYADIAGYLLLALLASVLLRRAWRKHAPV